jgi:hypothetical protein
MKISKKQLKVMLSTDVIFMIWAVFRSVDTLVYRKKKPLRFISQSVLNSRSKIGNTSQLILSPLGSQSKKSTLLGVGVTLHLEGIFYGHKRSKISTLFRRVKEKSSATA